MLIREFANVNINKKSINEGLVGSLAGTLGGMALGQKFAPDGYAPYGMAAGSMLGGALGNAAEEKIKQMMAKKQPAASEQLNEVAFLPFLIPALGVALRVGGPAIWNIAKFVARRPVTATVTGIAAANPVDTYNILKGGYDLFNIVSDPAAAAAEAGKKIWDSASEAATAIAKIVGDNLDAESIKALASVAVKYAIPVAAVIAMLYGGKKLYDYINNTSPSQDKKANA